MRNPARVASIVFAGAAAFCGTDAFAGGDAPNPGADTFAAKCASCHGKDASGNTTVGKKMGLRDLGSADVQNQTDKELYDITAKGKKKMPAYEKKLSEQQMKDLVTYTRTLAKK